MSIITDTVDKTTGRYKDGSASVRKADIKKDKVSGYTPDPITRQCINEFLKDFRNGWQTMHLPRAEFNDLSLYQRHIVDMLAFNTYQENDGNPMMEDRLGGWKSQAMRPVVRNKAISISAHRTARQLVPKIFAYNEANDAQEDSAQVMGYLVDWAREQADYPFMALYRDIAAIYSPISWGYSEYTRVYRNVKDSKNADGTWKYKQVEDEDESGFKHLPIATDQVYFPNFFERDPQKQDFIILRRIISYDKAKAKYGSIDAFKYVTPGIVVVMDDANASFYNVYDPHMRNEEVEEVIRWRKSTDSKEVMVNGVLLSEPYAPNERQDHQYPFDCFYYLPINERCIAGKSLVFAMQSDANIVNEFYQLIIDGTKLNTYPPTVTTGSDKVGVDVMVPGLSLSFAEKDVQMNPLKTVTDQSLGTAMNTLAKVESSVSESSQDPVQQGQEPGSDSTAYEISRIEQNAATVLGLSLKFMAASHVIPYGKLLLSDVLQYMTMPDAEKITAEGGLVYKAFFAKEPGATGKTNKIQFDGSMPDTMTDDEKMEMSYALLMQQGGMKSNVTLWKVNPILFRNHKYTFTVDQDVLNPRSADLTRAFDLETYDRAIASPVANQEKIFTDLLMATNPKTARDPKAFVQATPPPAPPAPMGLPEGSTPGGPQQIMPPANSAPQRGKPAGKPLSTSSKLPQEMAA
jgi:hypothetical protein